MSDFCGDCKHNATQPDSRSCIRADWTDGCRCLGFERDRDRCSLCTAVATVHLPPELGASALCRACADRVRAALEPPDEAERRLMEALANLGCRASRVPPLPRCPCPDCSRG